MAAALAEQGQEVSADLLPVDVIPPAVSYRSAFVVLSAARGRSQVGPNPIAYSEIIAYADANGFAETAIELQEFVQLIQGQDEEYLTQAAKLLAPNNTRG